MKVLPPGSKSDSDAPGDSFQITYATLDDIDALVALHLQCFSEKDHIAVLFGENFIRAAYKWFLTDAETYVLVAKKNQLLIGFSALADKPYDVPMLRAAKQEALAGLIRRPWLVFHPELILRLFRVLFPRRRIRPVSKLAQIAFDGVEPQFRGMGVGKTLKRESIRVCRERGMLAMLIGMKKENLHARAVSEGVGFVEVPELSTSRFIYLRLSLV